MSDTGSNAKCPRCGGSFHCGAQDDHCPCFDIELGEALRQQLKAQYGGSECLCMRCLAEIKSAASCGPAWPGSPPASPG